MKKRISLLLAAALCITITGCANQTTPTSSDSTSSSSSSSNDISNSSNDASQTISSAPILPGSTTSSSSSSNDTSQTSSSPSDTPTFPNEKIDEFIEKRNNQHNGYPCIHMDDRPYAKYYVCYDEMNEILISKISEGSTRGVDINLRNDILAIAYFSEKDPNVVSFLTTTDQAKSWQSSELEADYPQGFYQLAFRNTEDGIFILQDRDIDTDQSRGDNIIYTTDNTGKTWKQAGTLSGDYFIYELTVIEGSYWIVGVKGAYPIILKSDDGVSWREVQLSFDAARYTSGYCTEMYLSEEMGLATVAGRNANENVIMVYVSIDGGETWSYYKTDRSSSLNN